MHFALRLELSMPIDFPGFRYNTIFSEATFKTYMFRMRAKADTYNDETRVKHTAVSIDNIDYANVNK